MQIWRVGKDFQVLLTGGKAHIGAVAVAVCYDLQKGSCNVSQIAVYGHREESLAADLALKMAKALRTTVAFSAGIHFDDLTAGALAEVVEGARQLTEIALGALIGKVQHKGI